LDRSKQPCDLLTLLGVTQACKGLAPSGFSLYFHFFQRTWLYLPFEAHTKAIFNAGFSCNLKDGAIKKFSSSLKEKSNKVPHQT